MALGGVFRQHRSHGDLVVRMGEDRQDPVLALGAESAGNRLRQSESNE